MSARILRGDCLDVMARLKAEGAQPETWSGLSLADARANAEGCNADAIAALRAEHEKG